jgi:ABC-type multidrug transport system fused ATPase/permease subunit
MFERFYAGFSAARDCWEILRQDKKLLILPFLSGVACLVVLASFALPLAVFRPQELQALLNDDVPAGVDKVRPWVWLLLFAFYFCNYFVIYFFNAALIHCALFRFRGMEATVQDGLQAAARRLPELLGWALVSATVGVILKRIESANERVGQIVSALLGTTWTIVTYFVVPVLVVERVGPFQAIKRSAAILRDTWGEALGGRVGISWFLLPFWLLGIGLMVLGFFLMASVPVVGIAMMALTGIYMIVLGLVGAALETILLSGLYLYATQGEVPDEMDRATLQRAFEAR